MAEIPVVPGFRWGGVEAGIRKRPGRADLALLVADGPVVCTGLFTKNDAAAAPVNLSRTKALGGSARAVLMNAGCANACTGEQGKESAERMANALRGSGIDAAEVLIASTGVIGAQLPVEKIEKHAAALLASATPDGIRRFANAIMTTDTREKVAWRQGEVAGKLVTVAGTCKGAGMIMPNMATMLACVATDAAIDADTLLTLAREACWASFNAVTVDGDTSTNDTLYLLASGKAGNARVTTNEGPAYVALRALIRDTCVELAKMIAADGEGATKFVEVRVEGAYSEEEADIIARRIANSPLVKTAWHAADANWGRMVAAIGSCGLSIDTTLVSISIDGVDLVENGIGLGADAETDAQTQMKKPAFTVLVNLRRGGDARSVYTCDFSADYVKINAEYRS